MDPIIFTIFGATGDLTFRKLIPAIYSLFDKNLIKVFNVIGFARREWSDSDFRNHLENNVDKSKYNENKWNEFLTHISYVPSEFENKDGYNKVAEKIKEIESAEKENIKVFYLSVSPEYFLPISENISSSDLCVLCNENPNSRVVIEKPFGTDSENAMKVDASLRKSFLPEHIYRIDHFLGKESIQNILAFRFANSIFERLWEGRFIDHIQIKGDESLGVEERGLFYDKTGALRDMVQNHILQVLAITLMDAPQSLNARDIQSKRLDVIKNLYIQKNNKENLSVVRGQYEGYREEKNVGKNSDTETFISMKLGLNNEKWKGVPIYIRTGKNLKKKEFEISIKFKDQDLNIYDKMTGTQNDILTFRIQPDEGISLMMMAKEPGNEMKITPITLDFCYRPTFNQPILDSYVGLLQNIILADQSLFTSIEEVQAQWNFVSQYYSDIISTPIYFYPKGSYGPSESEDLLKTDGKTWVYNEQYTCAVRY